MNHRSNHKSNVESSGPSQPEDLSEFIDFSSYDLRTTIRLIVLSGESRRIDVKKLRKEGSIFIKDGEIYRVESTEGEGDEAFFNILSWEGEAHSDVYQANAPESNLRISTEVLLDLFRKDVSRT